jgi:hypothetical protein
MKTRKELKEEYKELKFRMGVFQIRNLDNGKVYVDSTTNINSIYNRLRLQLNFGNHPNEALQSDWKLLGEDHFKFEVLGEIEQKDGTQTDYAKELKALEQLWLDKLKPYGEKGYNREPK